jgi:tRNA U34 5-carboxymethylaminomethyl modifying GTPase MnmE/TrmE
MALRADVLLFVVDARAGITPDDRHHARWVHSLKRPTLLLANKSEGLRELDADCWELGFGPALAVSAEHGEGLGELYAALQVSCGTGLVVVRRFNSFVAALPRQACFRLAAAARAGCTAAARAAAAYSSGSHREAQRRQINVCERREWRQQAASRRA